ncbi:MAG: Uma2 family endonuclease [Polyangiaceae bacterium]|nr:Uma2 family endonuclease [Polyangiaceae bacterium]
MSSRGAKVSCPPAVPHAKALFPGQSNRTYPVDHQIAPPETRVEYVRGVEVFAAPAKEPHANAHSRINHVIQASVKAPYEVAIDMLTRVNAASDFAPDVSVYEPIFDAKTGKKTGRKLEEIAFEVVDRQSQRVPTIKAIDLVRRGVRRVFCLVVKDQQICEWSASLGRWEPFGPNDVITDPCFVRPIRAEALLNSILADDEVARALLLKKPPAIVAAIEEGREEGELAAKAEAVVQVLEARGLTVPDHVRAQILGTRDAEKLHRWIKDSVHVSKASDILKK